ncbi:MAG: PIN domain-containing protein, partial [Candidatus Sulfotelmatobacter sp.]
MSFLLDTNAISEWQKPLPNPGITEWMNSVDEDQLFLSVVTLAELRYGIERMAPGNRRRRYEQWLG